MLQECTKSESVSTPKINKTDQPASEKVKQRRTKRNLQKFRKYAKNKKTQTILMIKFY
jgi:hypothetical protein